VACESRIPGLSPLAGGAASLPNASSLGHLSLGRLEVAMPGVGHDAWGATAQGSPVSQAPRQPVLLGLAGARDGSLSPAPSTPHHQRGGEWRRPNQTKPDRPARVRTSFTSVRTEADRVWETSA
jgi:hypothetical protein